MTPEQKLFYLSLYLGAVVLITRKGADLPLRFQLIGINILEDSIRVDPGDSICETYKFWQLDDIKLILKEEPASYHEDDKANKAYWEEFYGKEQYIGTFYGSGTARSYVKAAGILWLILNKYDVFNLKSQDLAIYENNLCTK